MKTEQVVMPASHVKGRIASIDTLKAWAIIFVVMSHCHVINQGGVGNAIFFAVSGFMAAAPFSRRPLEVCFTSIKDVLVYYFKRIMRIMPPYWAIILTVNLVFPGTYFSSKRDLLSFLLLKNVRGHIWFMQNIMVLYLMTPLIGLLIAALFGLIRNIFKIKASSSIFKSSATMITNS